MSDYDLEKALRVIKRHGRPGMERLLALYPVLRHSAARPSMTERREEWERWMREIPPIVFPDGWEIRMRPPVSGAIVRFVAEGISVYLDCYARLGHYDGPYWELYPAEDGDTERYGVMDIEGLLDGLKRAVDANN